MAKRKQTKPRRAGRSSKKAASSSQGNRRRVARASTADGEISTARAPERALGREKIPPGVGGKLPRWVRIAARWGLRLGVASGLSYGLLFGVQEGYEFATTSPRFEARALVFEPTPHVSDAALRELMGIHPGTNILSLEVNSLAGTITAHPWVRKAVVTRELPDTLIVEVHEHQPKAVLLAGGFFLVGEDGMPFKPLESGERGMLPIITGLDEAMVFTAPEQAKRRVQTALTVLDAYATKRRPRLSEVHVDDSGATTLYTADLGSQLRLGRGDIEAALSRYDALRAALGEESDKLAVAHLDASSAHQGKDRVVASFFPTRDVPEFVEDAASQAEQRAREHADNEQAIVDAKKNKRKARHGGKSRLPHYE